MQSSRPSNTIPFAVACLGIALFSGMDAAMKGLSISLGAYNAMLWRAGIGVLISVGPYLFRHGGWPSRSGLRVHLLRGAVTAIMAVSFFYGIARVPLAEGIALSFIAPLIALYLAVVLLGEKVGRHSVIASVLGILGVAVLLAARIAATGDRNLFGVAAILLSAIFYAWNIILMRQQALLASPTEVAFFQNLTMGGFLLLAAPFFAIIPDAHHVPMLALSAALAFCSLLLLSWAYARAEAQVLVPVEYTAFIWASIMGAIFYAEPVTGTTIIGASFIVAGCVIAARGGRPDISKLEAAI
ncbi:DMT family transporter [Sphingomonas paeninsulae]|uniref:DMT family transporter n=1 Tax=Sphingomonas paeninsulae TaxID=2319844 RepID=A0A494TLT9_SPHPE|nr:DMT family transporter [Sphingomonas paeninsulae]AYJ87983.1 DMT family transporter [Sphingomonas paeninsulae]